MALKLIGYLKFVYLLANLLPFHFYGNAFQTASRVRIPRMAFPTRLYEKCNNEPNLNRRQFTSSIPVSVASLVSFPFSVFAGDETIREEAVQVIASGDLKKLFNEGRAMESQGNMLAAQRLYAKVTKLAPRVSQKISIIHIMSQSTF